MICNIPWLNLDELTGYVKTDWEIIKLSKMHDLKAVQELKPFVGVGFQLPDFVLSEISWFILPSAGYDHLDLAKLKENDIKLVNNHGNATTIAEHGFTLLMAANNYIGKYHSLVVKTNAWPPASHIRELNRNVHGKTLGIFGYGAIGKKISKISTAFDMKVLPFRKHPEEGQYNLNDYESVAPTLDFIITCLPENDETIGFFSEKRLKLLKGSCVFINIGRGSVVDEAGLFRLLNEKKLRAAGLDVWQDNPHLTDRDGIKPDEFSTTENLLISPYRAWRNQDSNTEVLKVIATHLDRIMLEGKTDGIVEIE